MVRVKPNRTEMRKPWMTRASTSRAWSSVPSRFRAEGGEGARAAEVPHDGAWR